MPTSLPYLASNKNIPTIFEKIASAKIPPKLTHGVLTTAMGLKSTNDRQLIPLLRNLGFLDQSNTPTPSYALLKGDKSKVAIADGVRAAYAPLFNSDENAYQLSSDKLRSLISQVAGTDDVMTSRIGHTFSSLVKLADFQASAGDAKEHVKNNARERSPAPIRPAPILFVPACAIVTGLVEQALPDIFPDSMRPIKSDRIRLLNCDDA